MLLDAHLVELPEILARLRVPGLPMELPGHCDLTRSLGVVSRRLSIDKVLTRKDLQRGLSLPDLVSLHQAIRGATHWVMTVHC